MPKLEFEFLLRVLATLLIEGSSSPLLLLLYKQSVAFLNKLLPRDPLFV